jgi:type I restriction enzyme, S subunit
MKWAKVKLHTLIEKPISGEWGTGEGTVNVIRTTNFTNDGTLDLSDVVSREIPYAKVEKKKLRHGDIIIEKSGGSPTQPVGRVVHFLVVKDEYLCNNFTSVLRPRDNVHPRFLFWCLFAGHINGSTLSYQNKTTGIINLQLERFCNEFEVPLPPLHIQEQIADTLDKADALRRKDQELLQKYDELAQSIFYDMFGDPVKKQKNDTFPLSELCIINPKKSEIDVNEDDMVSFVPMEDVDEFGNVHATKVRKFKDVSTGYTYFRDGDVLFAKITPCMENGKGGIARDLVNGIGFGSTEFHVVRPNGKITSEYLNTLLSLKSVRKKAEQHMSGSAGQKRVSKTFFDLLYLPEFSTKDIQDFSRRYAHVKNLRKILQDNQRLSNYLFSSLVSESFS